MAMLIIRKRTKTLLSILLALALLVSVPGGASAVLAGFGNFRYSGEYVAGQFIDVGGSEWFARYVEDAYNFGFFRGKGAGYFDHGGPLTLGEAVTLAARINSIFHTGRADFSESVPYYAVYANYALSHGIVSAHGNYGAPVTRAAFAELVYNTLPPEAFPAINQIADYGITDVVLGDSPSMAIYELYRAGILSGSDRFGTFFPDSNITRAEACAVAIRLADPAARIGVRLPAQIPGEVIYQRSTDAVFMLETFDKNGKSIRTGSGFFISGDGLAVTNLHVFQNAVTAMATLSGGEVYPVLGVHDISEENNLALFSLDAGAGSFRYLRLADSDLAEAGNTVYALGSPRALMNTITDGIISNTNRALDGSYFIQFTAPISFGSGGSPVLNALGQVVGVASSSFSYGQNLNLAVPVNYIKELSPGEVVTLEELLRILSEAES